MTRLSDRLIRVTLFATLIVGLITFLSSSASSNPATVISQDYTKNTASGNAQLMNHELEKAASQQLQQAQAEDAKILLGSKPESATQDSDLSIQIEKLGDGAQNPKFKVPASDSPLSGGFSSQTAAVKNVRQNATFVSLARNEDLWSLAEAVRSFEDRFNRNYNYDWVFLNNEEFNEQFKTMMTTIVSGETKFGLIPKHHWSYPEYVDTEKAAQTRIDMKDIIYGSSESYRHMCRFESGFFYHHPLMQQYQYYWRVEPSTKLHCDVDYDVFKFMKDEKKDYGFTISIHEFEATIKTLWASTKEFMKEHPQYLVKNNMLDFISADGGETYNLCHFWTNFEIGNMDFWRGEAYTAYFEFLDKKGGFFYERWGDAPVHSIAAALFLPRDRIHYFPEIGYFHGPYNNCPIDDALRAKHKCLCDPGNDFTWQDYSCTRRYHDIKGLAKPLGWEKHTG